MLLAGRALTPLILSIGAPAYSLALLKAGLPVVPAELMECIKSPTMSATGATAMLLATPLAALAAETGAVHSAGGGSIDTFLLGLLSGAVTRVAKGTPVPVYRTDPSKLNLLHIYLTVTSEVLLHPFDTIKSRQQAPSAGDGMTNSTALLFRNVYSGIVPALVGGVPSAAVFFGVKDVCRQELLHLGADKQLATLLAVCAANVPYWLIRSPPELLKTREQTSLLEGRQEWALFRALWRREGLGGVYSGLAANVAYSLTANVVKFLACTY